MEGEKDENRELRAVREAEAVEEEKEEDIEILKKEISNHPLYGLLVEAHLNCLKVGFGETAEIDTANAMNLNRLANFKLDSSLQSSPELDHFMEAYCFALEKLKEAMQKPLDETMCFIDATYLELREIGHLNNPGPTDLIATDNDQPN